MAKPYIHSKSSVAKWGGKVQDYLPIHNYMDQSKSHFPDNRHRALTHNSWFLFVLEDVFGPTIINSDGKEVSVRDVGEQHCIEDLGCIPSVQDYLENLDYKDWMNSKGKPSSHQKIVEKKKRQEPVNIRDIIVD